MNPLLKPLLEILSMSVLATANWLKKSQNKGNPRIRKGAELVFFGNLTNHGIFTNQFSNNQNCGNNRYSIKQLSCQQGQLPGTAIITFNFQEHTPLQTNFYFLTAQTLQLSSCIFWKDLRILVEAIQSIYCVIRKTGDVVFMLFFTSRD